MTGHSRDPLSEDSGVQRAAASRVPPAPVGRERRLRPAPQAIACPDCDLIQQIPRLLPRARACCVRCGCVLASQPGGSNDLPLALTAAAAIVFVIANVTPLMDLSVVGRSSSTTILGGAHEMWLQDEELAAALIAFCAFLAPGGYLLFMLTVLLGARRSPAPNWVAQMLRAAIHFRMWSTLDVMMLGILVALVKIAELATVTPGVGMYAAGALIFLLAAIAANFDPRELWQDIEWTDGSATLPQRRENLSAERSS